MMAILNLARRKKCGGMTVLKRKWLFYSGFLLGLVVCCNWGVFGQELESVHGSRDNGQERQMIFVAHEDDDLLFMNPDLIHKIRNGEWLETVYVTAGDKGKGPGYWLGREAGVREAYAYMAEVPDSWEQTIREIEGKMIVSFTLKAMPRIRLTFLRLPDGIDDRKGEITLKGVWQDKSSVIHSKDNVNTYQKKEIPLVFRGLMAEFRPAAVNYIYPGVHVDHRYVARFVRLTLKGCPGQYLAVKYRDYDINQYPPNLPDTETNIKWKIAKIYGSHDWYFPKFVLEKKYQVYLNWCKREYRS